MSETGISTGKQIAILAAGARGPAGAAGAMLMGDGQGRALAAWETSPTTLSLEHAALLAIVEGLRLAKDRRADEVTVYSPYPRLIARLGRRERFRWDDPMARDWVQARALTHAFVRCEFQTISEKDVRAVTQMAAHVADPREFAAAA